MRVRRRPRPPRASSPSGAPRLLEDVADREAAARVRRAPASSRARRGSARRTRRAAPIVSSCAASVGELRAHVDVQARDLEPERSRARRSRGAPLGREPELRAVVARPDRLVRVRLDAERHADEDAPDARRPPRARPRLRRRARRWRRPRRPRAAPRPTSRSRARRAARRRAPPRARTRARRARRRPLRLPPPRRGAAPRRSGTPSCRRGRARPATAARTSRARAAQRRPRSRRRAASRSAPRGALARRPPIPSSPSSIAAESGKSSSMRRLCLLRLRLMAQLLT